MDVDPAGVGVGPPDGPDAHREGHVTNHRHTALAFWSIAAFTVIMVTGLAIAGTLYQRQVNTSIRDQSYLSCLERTKLQVEHNNLGEAVNVALTDFAESRRELAATAAPHPARVMRATAARLTELAATIDPIRVAKCSR